MPFKRIVLLTLVLFTFAGDIHAISARHRVVRKVEVLGLQHLSKQQLAQEVTLLTKTGYVLKPETVDEDVERLFLSGYFTKVHYQIGREETGMAVRFYVEERPLVTAVRFIGNTRFSQGRLALLLKNRPGQILNISYLAKDLKRLRSYYHEEGYELFDVQTADLLPDGMLQIKVVEGNVHKVYLSGLKKTKPFVVRREFSQKNGEIFNSRILRKDRIRLLKLGYFSEVSLPKLEPLKDRNEVDVQYTFREKKINLLDLGIEQLRDDDGVAGFFRVFYNHLFMYSDVVSLKTQLILDGSLSVRSYTFRYFQPWAFNMLPVSMAFDLWTEFRNEPFSGESEARSNIREGVDFILGVPIIQDEITLSAKAKYETISPRDDETFDSYSIRSLSSILSWDTRNNVSNPDGGHYGILTIERGGDLGFYDFGGLDFTRWSINVAKFFRVSERGIMALHVNYGVFDRDPNVSIKTFESEEFPMGGVSSLRGYKELDFRGPRRLLLNLEYRHLLTRDIQGALFYDLGQIFDDEVSLDFAKYNHGVGFGFRFITGLAPFRLDFGWGRDFIIHFGIGQAF